MPASARASIYRLIAVSNAAFMADASAMHNAGNFALR